MGDVAPLYSEEKRFGFTKEFLAYFDNRPLLLFSATMGVTPGSIFFLLLFLILKYTLMFTDQKITIYYKNIFIVVFYVNFY